MRLFASVLLAFTFYTPTGTPEERPVIPDQLCVAFRGWQTLMRIHHPSDDRSSPEFSRGCMMREI